MSLSCAHYSPGNRASSSLHRPRFPTLVLSARILSICMLLPQLFNINISSTFHPHFDPPHRLAQPTFYPCFLITCLRPVQFQQPRKRSRGGQSGCELEIVLGATGKCCIWSPSTVTSWRKLYNRLVGISSFSRLPWWLSGKESSCQCRRPRFCPWVGKIPWRRELATRSSILAWRVPWTEEPGRLQSTGLQSQR